MVTQEAGVVAAPGDDDGKIRERAGWAPLRHFAERSVLGLLVVVAIGIGFGLLLLLVQLNVGPVLSVDRGVARELNELVSPRSYLVNALNGISRLGGRPFMFWLVGITVVLLLVRHRTRLAVYLVVTGVGALLLDPSVKALVGRLRPVVDAPVATAPGNSFPSGHALGAMVVYGALLLVFLPAVRYRKLFIASLGLVVFAVGLTRIALGVHYLTDVLAGWLLGALWLSVTAYAFRVWRREAGHPVAPLDEGLEPEAADAVKPAPDSARPVPHRWVKATEILTGWALIFGVLYLIGYLLKNQTEGTWLGRFDDGTVRWLQTFRTPGLDDLSWLWSKAGDTHAILIISLVFCPIALAVWRQWRPVLFLALTMVGELTLFLCTAASVQRARPPVEQLDGQMPTSSFPSGHIAATMCVWVAIAILIMGRVSQRWRYLAVVFAVVMPAGVALSRMYRGMHHPTDLLGAAILTTLWIGLLWWVLRPNEKPATAGTPAP
ncbi:phosphatase PAP2 family protein [Jidongwangia harbinensis]|uniref:phosphatase PAP2 family protein n=1 Tax=Jidongwangia harbinensis TaxID=2878561 RepID=UPI001CD9792A|nr:phosphatase PAP2 family protein [Jidongwangia harbinensis]MCA2217684.1 phosphatase PAP2 family protein [Jidongwangia harbinensis]